MLTTAVAKGYVCVFGVWSCSSVVGDGVREVWSCHAFGGGGALCDAALVNLARGCSSLYL